MSAGERHLWTCSSAGLFRVLALDSLRRRAAVLPGLLDELRPELGRSLGHHNDAIQSSALRLLADLLPRESDQRAGVPFLLAFTGGSETVWNSGAFAPLVAAHDRVFGSSLYLITLASQSAGGLQRTLFQIMDSLGVVYPKFI